MLPLLLRLLLLPSSSGRLLPPEEDMVGGYCKLDARHGNCVKLLLRVAQVQAAAGAAAGAEPHAKIQAPLPTMRSYVNLLDRRRSAEAATASAGR